MELLVGEPAQGEPQTIFDWFRKVYTEVSKIDSIALQVKSMSDKLDSMELDITVSTTQTYLTMLSDYQTNGVNSAVYTDKKQWDLLCRSSVMINSLQYNGEALDYWLEKGYDLSGYFSNIADVQSSLFENITSAQQVVSNLNCVQAIANSPTATCALTNSRHLLYAVVNANDTVRNICNTGYFAQYACSSRLIKFEELYKDNYCKNTIVSATYVSDGTFNKQLQCTFRNNIVITDVRVSFNVQSWQSYGWGYSVPNYTSNGSMVISRSINFTNGSLCNNKQMSAVSTGSGSGTTADYIAVRVYYLDCN